VSPRSNNISVLSNRYELKEQLGAGGMAEVYLGKDRVLGRTVAVKTLLAQYGGDPHFIERFRREAQHAAALNHPNVVSVYDTGSDDGTHYIVMEYVEGKTLRDVIREEGPLLPERVAEIGADVCAGLAFAHSHGIVHRDVKPANIMITTTGAVKVTDFGIARAVSGDTVTQTAMVLGTAQYFSPEQAQSAPVDARSDIYSLGVVLYEMLTRQVPFTGSSPVAIAYKHVKEAPVLPSRLNPDVPPALEAIVMKAMAKNPDNRYQSAEEMREDLMRALHGRPVQATPVLSDQTGMISPLSDETVVLERGGRSVVRQEYAPERKRRRTGWILLTFIVLAILGVAAWAILGLTSGPKTANIPDVTGKTTQQALDMLQKAGFQTRIQDAVNSPLDPGLVVRTDPPANTKAKTNTVVNVYPSGGPKVVTIPDVSGKTQAQATAALQAVGLKVGKVTRQSSELVAKDRVISTSPPANSQLQAGKSVDLLISSGKPLATVPSVVGLSQADAEDALRRANLNPQVVQDPTCLDASGNVCRQDPAAGQQVVEGSTVTIYVPVTGGSPSPTPSDTTSPTPTPSF
jgi:serine/threonine protein kinase